MERRKYRRFQVRLPVRFSSNQTEGQGQVMNISMGGCALKSQVDIKEGAFVRLFVILPDQGESKSMEVELAPVRWYKDGEFGMEFISMQREAQQRLYQFVGSLKAGANPPPMQQ